VDTIQLESFLTVVSRGSLTSAAKQLNFAPSKLSRRINLLEDFLGARLFSREQRSLALTSAGRRFVPHAQAIVGAMRAAKEEVMQKAQTFEIPQDRAGS
jgi:DNA-binding transcriptional LysR family regulator